jgi:hypothetical protein
VPVSKPVGETMRILRNAPEEMAGDFLKSLRKEAYLHGFSDSETFLDQTIAHPTDSHPPTRERITKMGATMPLSLAFLQNALRQENPDQPSWLEPLFANLNATILGLTGTLGGVIKEQEAQFEKELDAAAALPTESHILYERTLMNFLLIGGIGLACIGAGFAAIYNAHLNADPMRLKWIGGGAIALGLLVTWISKIYLKRGKKPFLELHKQGFCVPGATELIAWKNLAEVSFTQQKQMLTTSLQLTTEAAIEFRKDPLKRAKFHKKKHLLTIVAGTPKSMKVQAYVDLLMKYYNASRAREIQQSRQDEKAAIKARLQTSPPL